MSGGVSPVLGCQLLPQRFLPGLQATAPGSIISFITGDDQLSQIVCEEAKLFKITVSFGNVRSLIRCAHQNRPHAACVVERLSFMPHAGT
jgi:cystathionine beta-lyase/cystathionine gamma-synthase